jgi:hypothetical protein
MQIMTDGTKRKVYLELDTYEEQQRQLGKEYAVCKEKLVKTTRTYERLVDWGMKILARLAEPEETVDLSIPTGPNISAGPTQDSLEDLFSLIAQKIRGKLGQIYNEREEAQAEIVAQSGKKLDTILDEVGGN